MRPTHNYACQQSKWFAFIVLHQLSLFLIQIVLVFKSINVENAAELIKQTYIGDPFPLDHYQTHNNPQSVDLNIQKGSILEYNYLPIGSNYYSSENFYGNLPHSPYFDSQAPSAPVPSHATNLLWVLQTMQDQTGNHTPFLPNQHVRTNTNYQVPSGLANQNIGRPISNSQSSLHPNDPNFYQVSHYLKRQDQ